MKKEGKIIICLILLSLVILTITSCGIVGDKATKIKTDEQAKATVMNLTGDLDNLDSSLNSLNDKLS
ncbi:MAG TPA: hypothetical protein VJJ21_02055 [Candidatus Nanoarchaeia archaeon]|nr:hypothetical protein [Candidatus Nanoarchaeia archaeon]